MDLPIETVPISIQDTFEQAIVLTGLPIILFAVWADYYSRTIESEMKENPDFDRSACLREIRVAGLCALFLQAIFNGVLASFHSLHSLFCFVIFLAALGIQSQIQFNLEKKLRKMEATGSQNIAQLFKSLFWIFTTIAVYGTVIFGFAGLFYFAAKLVGAGPELRKFAPLLGQIFGVFVGLGVVYSLAPFFIRRMLPTTALKDSDSGTEALIRGCFAKAGIKTPLIYIIELQHFRNHNAFITGFHNGKGIFTPSLLISRSLLESLAPQELEAVVYHEISHISLRHIRKRFFYSIFAIIASVTASGGIITLANLILPPAIGGFVLFGAVLSQVMLQYTLIRKKVHQQEIDADEYAVFQYGADIEAFSQALRKLDQMNDQSSDKKDPNSYFSAGSAHPTTRARIELLQAKQKLLNSELEKPQASEAQKKEAA